MLLAEVAIACAGHVAAPSSRPISATEWFMVLVPACRKQAISHEPKIGREMSSDLRPKPTAVRPFRGNHQPGGENSILVERRVSPPHWRDRKRRPVGAARPGGSLRLSEAP